MKLVWHLLALEDREAIFDYLVVRNPQAAVDTDESIEAALNRLIDHPDSGREGRLAGTREVVIDGNPLYRRLPCPAGCLARPAAASRCQAMA